MFQYASGYAAARRLGVRLLLDPVNSNRLDHAQYGLSIFNLDAAIWAEDPKPRAAGWKTFLRKPKAKKRYEAWPGPLYRQNGQPYDSSFDAIGPGTYLMGYFQSERFFADVADEVRAAFSLSHHAGQLDPLLLEEMKTAPYVAVHIRRGDYASDTKTTAIHGLLGSDHYERARRLMSEIVPDARYLVFSDDMEAASKLTETWPHRRMSPGRNREEDLHLMSCCRHHIIANSTFSWWGAWLAQGKDKKVIAPRRWFGRDIMLKTFTDDIYPEGWILL